MIKTKYYEVITLDDIGLSRSYAIKMGKLKEGQKISLMSNSMKDIMLKNEEKLEYACSLLDGFVDVPYEELLNNIYLTKDTVDKEVEEEKNQSCDFVAILKDRIINIEVNNNPSSIYIDRNFHYATKWYASGVKSGSGKENYQYHYVLQLNLNNFAPKNFDGTYDVFMLKNNREECLTDKIVIVAG